MPDDLPPVPERVDAGVAFMDEHDPEWWHEDVERAIDLDWFSIIAGDRCILGQRCPLSFAEPGFTAYAEFLSGIKDEPSGECGTIWAWAIPLGFTWDNDASPYDHFAELDTLTDEWRRVITERRAAAKAGAAS